jgi:hypothetical protein
MKAVAAGLAALGLVVCVGAQSPAMSPRLFGGPAASALVAQGVLAPAPADAGSFQTVPAPGLRNVRNDAQATVAPWVDSNGWRFHRGLTRVNYDQLPAGASLLAAAEAFTFGVEAILNPDAADAEELTRLAAFLKASSRPALPPVANVGIVDDGSPEMGEILNMLTRRNLLYRVVPRGDRTLPATVEVGVPPFPRDMVTNPGDFAARVREALGDERRSVRLYGTSTVIAHLTGTTAHARLHLLSYSRNRSQPTVRVRVLGAYRPVALAAFGVAAGAGLTDVRQFGTEATEFSVPAFNTIAIVDLERVGSVSQMPDPTLVFESAFADREFDLSADPSRPEWVAAPRVVAGKRYDGTLVEGAPMEVRSRWTRDHLYLLYSCPYDQLHVKPDPTPAAETPRLWNWDVAEAFIGADFERIGFYKEFQVSPQGEWVDLAIDRDNPKTQGGMAWNSGYSVKARVDESARVWYGEMKIPFSAIDDRTPEKGRELRIGLFRLAGPPSARVQYIWRPSGQPNFHVPQAFGVLRLR